MKAIVFGHRGMVGSAIVRRLAQDGIRAMTADGDLRKCYLDASISCDIAFLAAAKVGGIMANSLRPAEFIYDNLMIQTRVIEWARHAKVGKLIFLGSSCIYPKFAAQPIKESALLTGPLEPTNDAYAIAKIAGIKMCQAYREQYGLRSICLMPTNLYGPGDKFDEDGHVIPGLIRKFHEAKMAGARTVKVWGSGQPRREFLHVEDLADAAVFLARTFDSPEPINVGSESDLTIAALASVIASVVGFEGAIEFDASKPDGTPRKLLDCSKLKELGWRASINLVDGIDATYAWYRESLKAAA